MTTPSSSPNRSGAGVLATPALAVVLAALALLSTSCRLGVVEPMRDVPARTAAGGLPVSSGLTDQDPPPVTIASMVPLVTHLRADASGGALTISGQFRFRDPFYTPFYDPMKVGGWALQVFLDTDQRNEGYWRGYDYVVRGVEWSPGAGTFVTRKITLDPSTPGGWGPEVGTATFDPKARSFAISIPLESVGGFDTKVNYCVETYATISCPDCSGGLTQEWSEDYFATLSDMRLHEVAGVSSPFIGGLAMKTLSTRGNGADAAAHLVGRTTAER